MYLIDYWSRLCSELHPSRPEGWADGVEGRAGSCRVWLNGDVSAGIRPLHCPSHWTLGSHSDSGHDSYVEEERGEEWREWRWKGGRLRVWRAKGGGEKGERQKNNCISIVEISFFIQTFIQSGKSHWEQAKILCTHNRYTANHIRVKENTFALLQASQKGPKLCKNNQHI